MLQKIRSFRMNKYWALGLVCVLLLLCVLLPAGRGTAPAVPPESTVASSEMPTEAPTTEPPAPAGPSGLAEIEGLDFLPGESVLDLCMDGDSPVAFLNRWDDEAKVWRNRLVTLDPETASVASVLELEPFGESPSLSFPEIAGSEIRFVDREGERCAAFDRGGRFLGLKDHPVMSRENLGWRNRLLSDGCFYKDLQWAEFSRGDSGELNRVVAFYDETDRVHIIGEPFDLIRGVRNHCLLTLRFGEAGEEELALLDLDSGLCLDRLSLFPESSQGEETVSVGYALPGDGWVLLSVSRCGPETDENELFFWYPEAGKETPADTDVLTEQFLTDGIDALRQELERSGMVLRLDEAPPTELTPTLGLSSFENTCETGASLFGQYWLLTGLADFVQKLPEGMIRELTAWRESDPEAPLEVYVVRSIPGDAAAFANAWTEPAMVCFATEEYAASHPAHEFMHIMDLRLSRYLDSRGRDLESEWAALSPDYAYDGEWLSDEQSEALEPYFVSAYAKTNSAEDRAECFEAIFDLEGPIEEAWWYADHPGVQAKLRWLTDAIRDAFPSVQSAESVPWDKLPMQEQ